MEITFVINVDETDKPNHIIRFTKTCKDFNDGFLQAYAEVKTIYRNVYPVVKFTLVNIEFL